MSTLANLEARQCALRALAQARVLCTRGLCTQQEVRHAARKLVGDLTASDEVRTKVNAGMASDSVALDRTEQLR